MLWALVVSAMVGFALGTQCRLIPLAATTALIAGVVSMAPPLAPEVADSSSSSPSYFLGSVLDFGPTLGAIIALIVTLQAFFLAGAVWRVLGPRFPLSAEPHNAPHGARASQAAHARAASAGDAGRDARID